MGAEELQRLYPLSEWSAFLDLKPTLLAHVNDRFCRGTLIRCPAMPPSFKEPRKFGCTGSIRSGSKRLLANLQVRPSFCSLVHEAVVVILCIYSVLDAPCVALDLVEHEQVVSTSAELCMSTRGCSSMP